MFDRASMDVPFGRLQAATPDKVQELVALLVERVETADKRVSRVTWVPAARPFFRDAQEENCVGVAPPERDSNSRRRP